MSKNDGGPAFACAAENGHQEGMSLRDWFAGQALVAFHSGRSRGYMKTREADLMADAEIIYQMADAMLKAREASDV